MRWAKRQERLINETIRHYQKEMRKPKKDRKLWDLKFCPFCQVYHCAGCPNRRISSKLFNFKKQCSCVFLALQTYTYGSHRGTILRRIQFWKDALKLTEKEFIKKWRAQ